MKLAKQIIKVLWPILYGVLLKQVEKTETEWDDRTLDAISFFIINWVETEEEEEDGK